MPRRWKSSGSCPGIPKRAQEELAALLAARRRARRGQSAATSTRSTARRSPPPGKHAEALGPRRPARARSAAHRRTTRCSPRPAHPGNGGMAGRRRRQGERVRQGGSRAIAGQRRDPYLAYWAAMSIGVTRARPRPTRGIARRAAGCAVAGRAAGQCRIAASAALYQLSNLYLDAEAAAERAGREPLRPIASATPPAAPRRW